MATTKIGRRWRFSVFRHQFSTVPHFSYLWISSYYQRRFIGMTMKADALTLKTTSTFILLTQYTRNIDKQWTIMYPKIITMDIYNIFLMLSHGGSYIPNFISNFRSHYRLWKLSLRSASATLIFCHVTYELVELFGKPFILYIIMFYEIVRK